MKQLITILLLGGYAALGAAAEQVCRHGDLTRAIEIEYKQPGRPVPCRVKYEKSGEVEYPWNAQVQAGYCEDRMAAFVAKLEGLGWQCVAQQAGAMQAEPEGGESQ